MSFSKRIRGSGAAAALSILAGGCAASPARIAPSAPTHLPVAAVVLEDESPKQDYRLVPPEVYVRTYLRLFGGLAPLATQNVARAKDGSNLFDTWDDYVSALGFPDYHADIPRQAQSNALMVAAFERLGIALCDRAVEHDLKGLPPRPVGEKVVFAFELTPGPLAPEEFAARFDVLHRTFLGYPDALAPPERLERFHRLFAETVAEHQAKSPRSRFSPEQAGWAAVCYGLVRHPEFHLY